MITCPDVGGSTSDVGGSTSETLEYVYQNARCQDTGTFKRVIEQSVLQLPALRTLAPCNAAALQIKYFPKWWIIDAFSYHQNAPGDMSKEETVQCKRTVQNRIRLQRYVPTALRKY